jgi:peroxiredoxin
MADARGWSELSAKAKGLGVRLVVATYDPVDDLESFARTFHIKIALLSDEGSKVIRALDILNEEHGPGSFAHGIPHPMVLVLDASGILRHRSSEEYYSQREVLNAARELAER